MKNNYINSAIVALILLIVSCITPFDPEGVSSIDNMIVIEGDIIQNDTTKVIISRSLALNDPNRINYISRATVWVESETGVRYSATEVRRGVQIQYHIKTMGINPNVRYKLCVLVNSKKYESDFIPVLKTPPIDSIGYTTDREKMSVTFYVNAYDPENKTRYYKWSFKEDWEFHSQYLSLFEYNPVTKKVNEIPMDMNRYYCWGKGVSSSILIASTTHLTEDRVIEKPLVSMGSSDKRVSYLYSMELTQMAISKEAYIYWENIRKNSNDIGGIFSPQPSEMAGNIKCVSNPSEVVIGYISAAVVSKRRNYAYGVDMDIYIPPKYCETVTVGPDNPANIDDLYLTGFDVVSYFEDTNESFWVTKRCVDCRVYGTKNKPSFWPNNHK